MISHVTNHSHIDVIMSYHSLNRPSPHCAWEYELAGNAEMFRFRLIHIHSASYAWCGGGLTLRQHARINNLAWSADTWCYCLTPVRSIMLLAVNTVNSDLWLWIVVWLVESRGWSTLAVLLLLVNLPFDRKYSFRKKTKKEFEQKKKCKDLLNKKNENA